MKNEYLLQLREELEEWSDKLCITDQGTISPFLNKPYNHIKPGVDSPFIFKFHQIYPELFNENFYAPSEDCMLGSGYSIRRGFTHGLWRMEYNEIYYREGHFDGEGDFHSPISAFESKEKYFGSKRFMLFQQGSYQILPRYQEKFLDEGKVLIFRGLKESVRFVRPQIAEDIRKEYMMYLAKTFVSPLVSFPKHIMICKSEINHVSGSTSLSRYLIPRHSFRSLEQSFSTDLFIGSKKFGPNYVVFQTPLDNLRIFTDWAGENEVYALNPEKLEDIKLSEVDF